MSTASHNEIATAIVRGQQKIMGAVAVKMASSALGSNVPEEGMVDLGERGVAGIEALVKHYSEITGPLGVRMCFSAAKPALDKHPDVSIPIFQPLR